MIPCVTDGCGGHVTEHFVPEFRPDGAIAFFNAIVEKPKPAPAEPGEPRPKQKAHKKARAKDPSAEGAPPRTAQDPLCRTLNPQHGPYAQRVAPERRRTGMQGSGPRVVPGLAGARYRCFRYRSVQKMSLEP